MSAERAEPTREGDELLKARDVADLLGLEMATVVDHAQRGDLPGFRLYGKRGGPLRFWRSEILAALEQWRIGDPPTVRGGSK